MIKPRLLIFASGTAEWGGSGFENLVLASRSGILDALIIGVVSNHSNGGVRERADRLGISFIFFEKTATPEKNEKQYQEIVRESGAEWVALSGWLKLVSGLDPKTTFNIHPGPLPEFGGKGMYGIHVHEAVLHAFKERGSSVHGAVTMHFVTPVYDEGPVFFRIAVPVLPSDTAESLQKRVNEMEHEWQSKITDKVIHGEISWDGKNRETLKGAELLY
ncbi:MAG: formyltransferase family protein [Patescibacteria group bacterium]